MYFIQFVSWCSKMCAERDTSGVVSADFNRDGFQDLLVVTSELRQFNRSFEGILLHSISL